MRHSHIIICNIEWHSPIFNWHPAFCENIWWPRPFGFTVWISLVTIWPLFLCRVQNDPKTKAVDGKTDLQLALNTAQVGRTWKWSASKIPAFQHILHRRNGKERKHCAGLSSHEISLHSWTYYSYNRWCGVLFLVWWEQSYTKLIFRKELSEKSRFLCFVCSTIWKYSSRCKSPRWLHKK